MGIIGLDEVGRGAWAGPLVFAGVVLPHRCSFIKELNDSKLLSVKKREKLTLLINSESLVVVAKIESSELDKIGLTAASTKACIQIAEKFSKELNIEGIILDGNVNYLKGSDYENITKVIPKADQTHPEVMAASIVAKQTRDKIMQDYEEVYPNYGFEKHVGYGTKFHKLAIEAHGVLPIHRKSFKPFAS